MRRLLVLVAVLLTGCCPAVSNDHLSTVDYWPEQQLLFVASRHSGVVDVMRVASSPRQGSLDFVERLTERTRYEVVRVSVDRTKGRVWVADRRMIYVYAFTPRAPATQIPFGRPDEKPISDLVLDRSGNAYVFLNSGAVIFRVGSETLRPEKWFETTYASSGSGTLSHGRAIVTKDGRHVIFKSPNDGSLIRLDLVSKQAVKIQRSTPIDLDCGPLLWTDDRGDGSANSVAVNPRSISLSVFHCFGRWIGEIKLSPEMSRSTEIYLSTNNE